MYAQGLCTAVHVMTLRCCCQVNARLTVLNLSQHTDSSDLLGGFRPVEARHSIAPLLPIFCTLVQRTWPRGKNEDFLSRIMKAAQRDQWSFVARTVAKAAEKASLSAPPLLKFVSDSL